jgi:hypothetical protein
MIKYGILTEKSQSDFNSQKKAEYYDAQGFEVADENTKHLLTSPKPVADLNPNLTNIDNV